MFLRARLLFPLVFAALTFFFAIHAYALDPFPSDIARFSATYQYNESTDDKYEYYLPNEMGDNWTRLVTVIRWHNNAGNAGMSDLEQISSNTVAVANAFPAEVTDMLDYSSFGTIPATRAFIVAYQFSDLSTNTWRLELDLEKFFVKNGYVYANLYAEKYSFSNAQQLVQKLSERRAALRTSMDAFVATAFPDPFSTSMPTLPSPPATTITYLGSVQGTSQMPTSAGNSVYVQLQALKTQLQALQTQVGSGASSAQTPSLQTTPSASSTPCLAVSTTLSFGAQGSEVLALQQYLIAKGYLSTDSATGFFGSKTQAAVQAFQAKAGIVSSGSPAATGYGVVGVRTRAALNACTITMPVGAVMKVSPVSGPATLEVTVNALINTTQDCGASAYALDFGDGTNVQTISVPSGTCTYLPLTFKHSYGFPGNYTIFLYSGTHRTSASITVTN